jgi:hypothetical protein
LLEADGAFEIGLGIVVYVENDARFVAGELRAL